MPGSKPCADRAWIKAIPSWPLGPPSASSSELLSPVTAGRSAASREAWGSAYSICTRVLGEQVLSSWAPPVLTHTALQGPIGTPFSRHTGTTERAGGHVVF